MAYDNILPTATVAICLLAAGACSNTPGREAAGSAASAASASAALDIADRERATGDYPGAISFYRRALELVPDQPKALMGLGYSLLDGGAPNEAAEAFQRILNKVPRDAGAETGLGETLLALDQPVAAADRLRKGLAAGGDPRGFRALGIADDLLGEFSEAEADYQRGLASAPNDLALRDDLGLSQALAGNFDAGIANLRAVAAAPGATAQHRLNLALGLGLAGRTEDAERVARIDLDERSVQSNIAYYAVLRGLSPKGRSEALLRPGPRTPLTQSTVAN